MSRGHIGTENQKAPDNNLMHAKPDLRVFLEWMIARSGSVITDVIQLGFVTSNAILVSRRENVAKENDNSFNCSQGYIC